MIGLIAAWLVKRSIAAGGGLTLPFARRMAKIGLIALALVLAVAAFLIWDHLDDKAAIKQHEARVTVEALGKARAADSAATHASTQTQTEVEQANDDARAAAQGSDDPLAAGLRRLR